MANTIERLLGRALANPTPIHLLLRMQRGMEQLAERDADKQLARLLQKLKLNLPKGSNNATVVTRRLRQCEATLASPVKDWQSYKIR